MRVAEPMAATAGKVHEGCKRVLEATDGNRINQGNEKQGNPSDVSLKSKTEGTCSLKFTNLNEDGIS